MTYTNGPFITSQTFNHEVVLCFCKICDWSVNLFLDTSVYIKGIKKDRSEHGICGFQKACCGAMSSLAVNVGTMAEKCRFYNRLSFSWSNDTIVMGKEGNKKKGSRSNKKKSQKLPFLGKYEKKQRIHFLVHGHFSFIVYT
jgi:hypothetical protein